MPGGSSPINGEFLMIRLRAWKINMREMSRERRDNPSPGRPAAPTGICLTRALPILLHRVQLQLTAKGDAGFEQQQPAALGGKKLERPIRARKMIEQSVAVDDLKGGPFNRSGRLEVEGPNRQTGKTRGENREIIRPGLGDRYLAAAISVIAGMVANPRAHLEDGAPTDLQMQAGKMLKPPGVVPQIERVMKNLFRRTKAAELKSEFL